MLENFNIQPFKKLTPPGDYTFDTMQEIKALTKLPFNKKIVEEFDDIVAAFKKTAKSVGIKENIEDLVTMLTNTSRPSILEIKDYFNRPRPKVLAKKMNIKMKDHELESMSTPSYPSGHSAQGILIGLVLSDKYPKFKKAFMRTAHNISDSRNIGRGHYKSDSDLGKKIGVAMYEYIKDKV